MSQKAVLRILDANYNRAKEALRVTEDMARFYLADAKLTAHLKRARHDLTKALLRFGIPYRKLVEARDSKEDVGRASLLRDKKRLGWRDLLVSNFKRGEEAIRVLEEFSKMIEPKETRALQRLRFRMYELEKSCLQKF